MEEKHNIACSEQMWKNSVPFCPLEGCLWFAQVLGTVMISTLFLPRQTKQPQWTSWFAQHGKNFSVPHPWAALRLLCPTLIQVWNKHTMFRDSDKPLWSPLPLPPLILSKWHPTPQCPATSAVQRSFLTAHFPLLFQFQLESFRW